mgnify:CR=1 FL=1
MLWIPNFEKKKTEESFDPHYKPLIESIKKIKNFREKKIIILDNLNLNKISTKNISIKLKKLGTESALLIDTNKIDKNFKNSALNLHNINVILTVGLNVYDILKFNNLIFTKAALKEIEKRLL